MLAVRCTSAPLWTQAGDILNPFELSIWPKNSDFGCEPEGVHVHCRLWHNFGTLQTLWNATSWIWIACRWISPTGCAAHCSRSNFSRHKLGTFQKRKKKMNKSDIQAWWQKPRETVNYILRWFYFLKFCWRTPKIWYVIFRQTIWRTSRPMCWTKYETNWATSGNRWVSPPSTSPNWASLTGW